MLLVADRVEVLSNRHNRRHVWAVRTTVTKSIICKSEDPYKTWCRLCGKAPESVAHNSVWVWWAYTEQVHIPFATRLCFKDTFLWDAAWSGTHRWSFSLVISGQAKACIRVGRCTSLLGRASFCRSWRCERNRVDARIVNHKTKRVTTLKMSCPWVNNREKKSKEKTVKYVPLLWELSSSSLVTKWNNPTSSSSGDGQVYNVRGCGEQK